MGFKDRLAAANAAAAEQRAKGADERAKRKEKIKDLQTKHAADNAERKASNKAANEERREEISTAWADAKERVHNDREDRSLGGWGWKKKPRKP